MSLEAIVANSIAERVHKDQKDLAGISMMHHVYGVSRAVKHLGDKYIIVALLHDSIEDAHESIREDIESEIKAVFDEEIVDAVYAMTHRINEAYHDEYLVRVMKNPIAQVVKIADIKNNLSRMDNIDDPEIRRILENKYHKALEILEETSE